MFDGVLLGDRAGNNYVPFAAQGSSLAPKAAPSKQNALTDKRTRLVLVFRPSQEMFFSLWAGKELCGAQALARQRRFQTAEYLGATTGDQRARRGLRAAKVTENDARWERRGRDVARRFVCARCDRRGPEDPR